MAGRNAERFSYGSSLLLRPSFDRPRNNRPAGRCVASPGDDWSLLEAGHPNVLVIGPREATRAFLLTITPWLQAPIRRLSCDTVLSLPAAASTLVLDDIDLLPDEEQQALLDWLEITQSAPQIVSLTTGSLYDRVQSGTFLGALYYRLNLLHLQVDQA